MDLNPTMAEADGRREQRFSNHVADWSYLAEEFGVRDEDGDAGYDQVRLVIGGIGRTLRTCSPEELMMLLRDDLGLPVAIAEGGGNASASPLLHEHNDWEIPDSTPENATTWTAFCKTAGCRQRRRIMRD